MSEIYFLSIHDQYVSMIMSGKKTWEFRKNPCFGILSDREIKKGDMLFIISIFPGVKRPPIIKCMCRILHILRNEELKCHFQEKNSGNWKESGCDENTERDWTFFKENILDEYSTAINLKAFVVNPPVDVSLIRHRIKESPWKGTGLTPAKSLKRFLIEGENISDYFFELSSKIASET